MKSILPPLFFLALSLTFLYGQNVTKDNPEMPPTAQQPDSVKLSRLQVICPAQFSNARMKLYLQQPVEVSTKGEPSHFRKVFTVQIPTTLDSIQPGYYLLEITKARYEARFLHVWLIPGETKTVYVKLRPLSRLKALLYSTVYPGNGQLYLKRKTPGYLFVGGFTLSLAGMLFAQVNLNERYDLYHKARVAYQVNEDPATMDDLYNDMKSKFDRMKSSERLRDTFLVSAGVVYALNLIDALMCFYRHQQPQQSPGVSFKGRIMSPNAATVGIVFRYSF